MAGFVRKFIKNYGTLAKPLDQLVAKLTKAPRLKFEEEFKEEHKAAVKELARKIKPQPVHADPSRPFFLLTDASTTGVGMYCANRQGPKHTG